MIETVKLFQKMVTCDLFFIDAFQPNADEFAQTLRYGGRTPVGYLGVKDWGADFIARRNGISQTIVYLEQLKERGWQLVELAAFSAADTEALNTIIKAAGFMGLEIALHGHASKLFDLNPTAATASEVRANREGKFYTKFTDKLNKPLFVTEYGKPSAPGKAQIDLKTYAIKNRVSMTLMNRETAKNLPEFHYSVHF